MIYRIFYKLDRSGLGKLTLRDLKRYELFTTQRLPSSFIHAFPRPVSSLQNLLPLRDSQCAYQHSYSSLVHLGVLNSGSNGTDACRGDLLEALQQLDDEEDINKVLKYFSYEHFYVIYCKVSQALPKRQ